MTKQVQNSGNRDDKVQLTRRDANTLVRGRRSLLVGAAAVIAAAFVFHHTYGPLTEGPRDTKTQPTATATAAPRPRIEVRDKKPTPNDGKCEVDRGEHDPLSGYFNENDCGYCGNDKVDGPWEEEKGETPCYYDLHQCGNGTLDKKATYSVWTKKDDGFEMKDPKEKEGESCIKGAKNYCDGPECGVKKPQGPCGNGKMDPGEQCDPTAPGGNTCEADKVCVACQCREKPQKAECGDGIITPPERCDPASSAPRGGCPAKQECSPSCTCKKKQQQARKPCTNLSSSNLREMISSTKQMLKNQKSGLRALVTTNPGDAVTGKCTINSTEGGAASPGGCIIDCTGVCDVAPRAPGPAPNAEGNIGEQDADCYVKFDKDL